MELADHSLALLGVVLMLGLLGPSLFARFQLPLASSLLLVGALVGPHGAGWVQSDATLVTFAYLGATFHVFLAGLESRGLAMGLRDRENLLLVGTVGLLPAALATLLVLLFGYGLHAALFVGGTSLSTSLLLVFALVQFHGEQAAAFAERAKVLAVTLELASTVVVFGLLKAADPHPRFPLPIHLGLVLVAVAALRMYLPEVAAAVFARLERTPSEGQERHVRFTLALLLMILFGFATLDVPSFLAAFMVGFAMAPVEGAPQVREKLRLIGHALFIPVFLFAVGLDTDLGVFVRWEWGNLLVILLVLAAVGGKVYGGYAGGRQLGLAPRQALALGVLSTPRLSVSVTAGYAGFRAGVLDATLLTAVVVTSVVTSVLAPAVLALPWWRVEEGA